MLLLKLNVGDTTQVALTSLLLIPTPSPPSPPDSHTQPRYFPRSCVCVYERVHVCGPKCVCVGGRGRVLLCTCVYLCLWRPRVDEGSSSWAFPLFSEGGLAAELCYSWLLSPAFSGDPDSEAGITHTQHAHTCLRGSQPPVLSFAGQTL